MKKCLVILAVLLWAGAAWGDNWGGIDPGILPDGVVLPQDNGDIYFYEPEQGYWGTVASIDSISTMEVPLYFIVDGKDGRKYRFELVVDWGEVDEYGVRTIPKGAVPQLKFIFKGIELD